MVVKIGSKKARVTKSESGNILTAMKHNICMRVRRKLAVAIEPQILQSNSKGFDPNLTLCTTDITPKITTCDNSICFSTFTKIVKKYHEKLHFTMVKASNLDVKKYILCHGQMQLKSQQLC